MDPEENVKEQWRLLSKPWNSDDEDRMQELRTALNNWSGFAASQLPPNQNDISNWRTISVKL